MANRSVSAGKASFLDKAFLLGLGKPKSRLQVQSVDDTSKLSSFATLDLSAFQKETLGSFFTKLFCYFLAQLQNCQIIQVTLIAPRIDYVMFFIQKLCQMTLVISWRGITKVSSNPQF